MGPASVMVGNLVQGNRLASAQGRDIGLAEDNERKHQLITGVLRWRANSSPDHVLYTLLNSKGAISKTLTCSELHKRAEKIAALIQERGKINAGDHVGKNYKLDKCLNKSKIKFSLFYSFDFPSRIGFDLWFLRMFVSGCCTRHHSTPTSTEFDHHITDSSNDCGRI